MARHAERALQLIAQVGVERRHAQRALYSQIVGAMARHAERALQLIAQVGVERRHAQRALYSQIVGVRARHAERALPGLIAQKSAGV
jgi:hypothetical protein